MGNQYQNLIKLVLDQIMNSEAPIKFTETEREALARARNGVLGLSDSGMPFAYRWFPKYACVLLLTPVEEYMDTCRYSLHLLGLDNWDMHPMVQIENVMQHHSEACGFKIYHLGKIDKIKMMEKIMESFEILFSDAKNKEGNDRHAVLGKTGGHQKTPSFVHACLDLAIKQKDEKDKKMECSIQPKGGMTDVGLHTGGSPRNVTWPLIRETFRYLLSLREENRDLTFDRFMFCLHYYVFNHALDRVTEEKSLSANDLDELYEVAKNMGDLAQSFNDCFDVVTTCTAKIEEIQEIFLKERLKNKVLKNEHLVRHPVLDEPSLLTRESRLMSFEAIRKRALESIGQLTIDSEYFDGEEEPFSKLLSWMEKFDSKDRRSSVSSTEKKFLTISMIDKVVATLGLRLLDENESNWEPSNSEIEIAYTVMEKYYNIVNEICRDFADFSVQVRSLEMLNTWLLTCLVHKHACNMHPLLKEYDIPIDPRDLQYLVLKNKESWDLARITFLYLKKHEEQSSRRPIFLIGDDTGTVDFSLRFAKSKEYILNHLKIERQKSKEKEDSWYASVTRKRQNLIKLDNDLKYKKRLLAQAEKELQLAEAEKELQDENMKYNYRAINNAILRKCESINDQVSKLKGEISIIRNSIAENEKAPNFVVHALPQNTNLALVVLFHLFFVPVEIEYFSRFLFLSQQMLFANRRGTKDGPGYKTTWVEHYQKYFGTYKIDQKRHSKLFPENYYVPKNHGPSNVRYISSSSEGQWYPDFSSGLALPSGLNPFKFDDEERDSISQFYTFQIEESYQWSINAPELVNEKGSSRGNLSYSEIVSTYMKSEHVCIGNIRSYPMLQIDKLLHAINRNELPLIHVDVQKLVLQAFFHLGEIDDDGEFLWKDVLFDLQGSGFRTLYDVLRLQADYLKNSPGKHMIHMVLGELASFCMQYKDFLVPNCEDLELDFVRMAENWAFDNLDQAVKGAATKPKSILASLKSKAFLFFGYSICCISNCQNIKVVANIIRNNILLNHYKVFVSELDLDFDRNLFEQCLKMKLKVQNTMSKLIIPIILLIESLETPNLNEILTDAIRSVFEGAPKHLEWERINDSVCFEAIDVEQKSHYSVNILSGVILFDGAPPCRLPAEILQHRLYLETFGENREFNVSVSKDQVYKSLAPLDGYFYTFSIIEDGLNNHLKLTEIDERNKIELELLDFEKRLTWWSDVPIRLKLMLNHWYHQTTRTIIMRPKFNDLLNGKVDRSNHALAIINDKHRAVFNVPNSLCNKNWSDIAILSEKLESFEKLDSNMEIFSAFEDPAYIHVFRCRNTSRIRIFLPRYDLSFIKERRGHRFISKEFPDYHLAEHQVLPKTLPFFEHYLVLESKVQTRLLVPCGEISKNDIDSKTRILTSGKFDINIKYFCYDLNSRTGFFSSNSIAAQLHWAAILSASGSNVRDPLMGMTGSEAAMTIVRQCFCSRPITELENDRLEDIIKYSHREPGLKILCQEVKSHANYLSFLYGEEINDGHTHWFNDAVMEYVDLEERKILNVRRCITDQESSFMCLQTRPKLAKPLKEKYLNFASDLVSPNFVSKAEDTLLSTIVLVKRPETTKFPLKYETSSKSALNDVLIGDLKSSLEKYHSVPGESVIDIRILKTTISMMKNDVKGHLNRIQEYFNHIQAESNQGYMKMEVAINRMPKWGFRDLLIFVRDIDDKDGQKHKEYLRQFFPRLSDSSIEYFREAAIKYLELCILNDKLERIALRIKDCQSDDLYLIRELKCKRIWDSRKHPRWIVFEAESGIQIRPEQYIIAKHLLENPGSITQLNMGYGKTRVIAPMLVIEVTKRRDHLVRLFILPSVLNEAIDFMQETLMIKSVLQVRVFSQPFMREIELDLRRINRFRHITDFAQKTGGFMILAPEHKLSLELKMSEVGLNNCGVIPLINQLKSITDNRHKFDILDEADEILSYKYQLVYAIETDMQKKIPLEDGPIRWTCAQALLNVLNNSEKIAKALDNFSKYFTGGFHVQSEEKKRGKFRQIRLIEALSDEQKAARKTLKLMILEELIASPPYEFQWIKEVADNLIPARVLMESVLNMEVGIDQHLLNYMDIFNRHPTYFQTILALRGLLGCDLLEYCLQLRYRVNYGIDPKRCKKLAVPFKAADLPSTRSEFSHPDVGIVKTILSFYNSGISREQMLDTLKLLVSLGPFAKRVIYQTWFNRVKDNILDSRDRSKIDSHDKIDVTNASQVNLLHETYCHCMETIDFWLNNFVFPKDTAIYPFRIGKSAFDIAHKEAVGFSGTKDTRLLHPIQMRQNEPHDNVLLGTDGKMLDLLIKKASYKSLNVDGEIWKGLLDMASREKVHALIDAGSLLAGVLNENAARHLCTLLQNSPDFLGVIYFEPKSKRRGGEWMVMHLETGEITCKADSPIKDSEAFIIFDDARTRGADMKMSPNATALLTLGPNVIKDKLMQSAGRLRQLEGGQKLIITATKETEAQIKVYRKDEGISLPHVSCIDAVDILQWTLENTKQATVKGLLTWANNGMVHYQSVENEKDALIREDWSLKTLYSLSVNSAMLSTVISQKGSILGEYMRSKGCDIKFLQSLLLHTSKFGENIEILENSADQSEECEREMQLEKQQQNEKEVDPVKLLAIREDVWNYRAILQAQTINDVRNLIGIKNFSQINRCSPEIQDIAWHANLYGTVNFFKTIHGMRDNLVSMAHARKIEFLIIFKDGKWLALSDQEAEGILRTIVLNPTMKPKFLFINSQSLISVIKGDDNDLCRGNQAILHDAKRQYGLIASVSLFNGETGFVNDEVARAVTSSLVNPNAKKQIQNLVQAKGLYRFYSLSKLEEICSSALNNS